MEYMKDCLNKTKKMIFMMSFQVTILSKAIKVHGMENWLEIKCILKTFTGNYP